MADLEKISVEEIKEAVDGRKVLQEINSLHTHLNLRVNGADLHLRTKMERSELLAYKHIIRLGDDDEITFDGFREEYDFQYQELISLIKRCVDHFDYRV